LKRQHTVPGQGAESDSPTEGLGLSDSLLQVLRCPRCAAVGGGHLRSEINGRLECFDCRRIYRVEQGVPVMLVSEDEADSKGEAVARGSARMAHSAGPRAGCCRPGT